jgi:hypothetical protein
MKKADIDTKVSSMKGKGVLDLEDPANYYGYAVDASDSDGQGYSIAEMEGRDPPSNWWGHPIAPGGPGGAPAPLPVSDA